MAIGDVNRAKLYYLRGKVGKKARVRERRDGVRLSSTGAAAVPAEQPPAEDSEPEEVSEPEVEQLAEEPAGEPEPETTEEG